MEGRGLASHLVVNSVLKSSDPFSRSLSPLSIAMKIIYHSTWISLSQGYPSDSLMIYCYPFIILGGKRHCGLKF